MSLEAIHLREPVTAQGGALFLDRDGVVNEDRNFVARREDFIWRPGIFDLVDAGLRRGLCTVVVTNQSGIARGLYSETDYRVLTDWMCSEFAVRGMPLAGVYHCPWHPEASVSAYRGDHPWRKPNPGMLLAAANDLSLDLAASLMIGDRWPDIAAAQAAGVPVRILVGDGARDTKPEAIEATARLADVSAAAAWLADAMLPCGAL